MEVSILYKANRCSINTYQVAHTHFPKFFINIIENLVMNKNKERTKEKIIIPKRESANGTRVPMRGAS